MTTNRPEVLDIQATEIATLLICKSTAATIEKKQNYILFIFRINYGVTVDGTCGSLRFVYSNLTIFKNSKIKIKN